jgi:hypothetical protein
MICGRGGGKTFAASLLCAMKAINGERVLVFAQGYKALTENLFNEITKRLDTILGFGNYIYNKGQVKISIPGKGVIYGLTYQNIDACRGYTEINSLVLDEGCLAPATILDTAVPCMRGTGKETQIYVTSTPKAGSYLNRLILDKLEKDKDEIELIKAKTTDNLFISEQEFKLMSQSISNQTLYRQELMGEILNLQAANSIIAGIVFKNKYKQDNLPDVGQVVIGIDGSGYGKDKTVITYRLGKCYKQVSYETLTGMACRNEVKAMLSKHPKWKVVEINIDAAYGDKYYENLELEYDCCNLVNFGGKARNEKYFNKRAELYFNLIEGLNKGVPLTEEIEDELNVTLFEFSNTGKLKLVDKDEIKEVLKHSPDQSDSLALTFNTGNLYETEEIEEQHTLKYRPWQ